MATFRLKDAENIRVIAEKEKKQYQFFVWKTGLGPVGEVSLPLYPLFEQKGREAFRMEGLDELSDEEWLSLVRFLDIFRDGLEEHMEKRVLF